MGLNYQLINGDKELEQAIEEITANHSVVAVDTEGDFDVWSGTTVLIQIGVPGISYLIDIRSIKEISALFRLLESTDILKILQNAKYDYQALKKRFGIELTNVFDTMIAEQLILAGKSSREDFSLDSISRNYLEQPLSKSVRSRFERSPVFFTQEMLEYAATDVAVLLEIYPKQLEELNKWGLEKIAQLEFDLVPVVAELELNGVLIDLDKWKELTQWLTEQRTITARNIYAMATEKIPQLAMFDDAPIINLNSPKQVLNLLHLFGLKVQNTKAEALKRINHPLTDNLVDYKLYQKLISTYGEPMLAFIKPQTGRVHAQFWQLGAQSGRFSCQKPNLQNIPIKKTKKFRECFVAPFGYKLITADYSQIELRIIAEWSKDEELLRAFRAGGDIHRWVASKLFRKELSSISKTERDYAKNMVYGMSYGMSAEGFARRAEIDLKDAQALLDIFKKTFAAANEWLMLAGNYTVKKGYSRTLWGRKRWFDVPKYNDPNYNFVMGQIKREGRNHAVQGTGGDMLKLALVRLYQALKPFDAKIVNCIHDEIVIEVVESQAVEVSEVVSATMIAAGEELLPSLPVEVDVYVGDAWGKG